MNEAGLATAPQRTEAPSRDLGIIRRFVRKGKAKGEDKILVGRSKKVRGSQELRAN